MKLPAVIAACLALSAVAAAQTPAKKPIDPILTDIVTSSANSGAHVLNGAQLSHLEEAWGSTFRVLDSPYVRTRATAGMTVQGLANVFGGGLLGAVVRLSTDAQTCSWTYNNQTCSVQSTAPVANGNLCIQLGPYVVYNYTASHTGFATYSPWWHLTRTKHVFDVSNHYPTAWGLVEVTLLIGADAGGAANLSATLRPSLYHGGLDGSAARFSGLARGWMTGVASATIGGFCASATVQADLRMADSRFAGNIDALPDVVHGQGALYQVPLAMVASIFYGSCLLSTGVVPVWNLSTELDGQSYDF